MGNRFEVAVGVGTTRSVSDAAVNFPHRRTRTTDMYAHGGRWAIVCPRPLGCKWNIYAQVLEVVTTGERLRSAPWQAVAAAADERRTLLSWGGQHPKARNPTIWRMPGCDPASLIAVCPWLS